MIEIIRSAVIIAALTAALSSAAAAQWRITNDQGGALGAYILKYSQWRKSGERVVIDGPCMSACTIVLGLVPAQRICVTPRAILGFHATRIANGAGVPASGGWSTATLMSMYPRSVQAWINRHGGLSARMIYLGGPELAALYPVCP